MPFKKLLLRDLTPDFSRLPDRPGCSLMYRCQAAVGYSLLTSAPLCLWNPPIQMVWAAIWGQHIKDGWTHLQPALLSCDAVGPLRWFACRVSCIGSCTGGYQTLWMCSGWILSDDFTPATIDSRDVHSMSIACLVLESHI